MTAPSRHCGCSSTIGSLRHYSNEIKANVLPRLAEELQLQRLKMTQLSSSFLNEVIRYAILIFTNSHCFRYLSRFLFRLNLWKQIFTETAQNCLSYRFVKRTPHIYMWYYSTVGIEPVHLMTPPVAKRPQMCHSCHWTRLLQVLPPMIHRWSMSAEHGGRAGVVRGSLTAVIVHGYHSLVWHLATRFGESYGDCLRRHLLWLLL